MIRVIVALVKDPLFKTTIQGEYSELGGKKRASDKGAPSPPFCSP